MKVPAAVLVLAVACGGGSSAPSRSPSPVVEAVRGLCDAAGRAAKDPAAARRTFFDRSHDALHGLAASVAERDRAAAARILTAKEQVESGVDLAGADLRVSLEALWTEAAGGLRVLGMPVPRCAARAGG